jgi:hypothetical protein
MDFYTNSIMPGLDNYNQVNSQDYNHQIQVWQPPLGDILTVSHCPDPL